jgi:hypothetical protein
MNNKFWNAPAWSLGNRFKGTLPIIKANKTINKKDLLFLVLAVIISKFMDIKQDASIQ